MTVDHICVSRAAEHTDKAAASGVPRAPERGDLVGVVDSDIGKSELVAVGVACVTTDTYDTAVTGVVNSGITVGDSDILKGGVTSISCDNAGGSKLAVRGEVVYRKVLYRCVNKVAEQTHTVLVVVAVVVTLGVPGVLIEVRDLVSLTVEGTLEGGYGAVIITLGSIAVVILGVVVADGME